MEERNDQDWMKEALKEARKALQSGEVPIGAVVVREGRVIGRGHNSVETLKDATAHAEIIAIGAASAGLGDWRLEGSVLYVTAEPCMMCLGAVYLSRVSRVVFGVWDRRAGACGGALHLEASAYMDRGIATGGGVLESDCQGLLVDFFSKMRKSKKP